MPRREGLTSRIVPKPLWLSFICDLRGNWNKWQNGGQKTSTQPSFYDVVKKELGLEKDDIIDIYQSLVKHEICLMRLGDICTTESGGGYYVAKHGFSVRHN
jgi:hypothetical protein